MSATKSNAGHVRSGRKFFGAAKLSDEAGSGLVLTIDLLEPANCSCQPYMLRFAVRPTACLIRLGAAFRLEGFLDKEEKRTI
jgi:hypothetical protein